MLEIPVDDQWVEIHIDTVYRTSKYLNIIGKVPQYKFGQAVLVQRDDYIYGRIHTGEGLAITILPGNNGDYLVRKIDAAKFESKGNCGVGEGNQPDRKVKYRKGTLHLDRPIPPAAKGEKQ